MFLFRCNCCGQPEAALESGEVLPVSAESALQVDPLKHKFRVFLDRTDGKRLGISVIESGRFLQIVRVDEEKTAAGAWNAEHDEATIKVGDFLLSVDGHTVHEDIKTGCQQWRLLEIELRRETSAERERRAELGTLT